MAGSSNLAADLLRGGREIAQEIYGNADPSMLRRFYYEVSRGVWPVFRHDENGTMYALRSAIKNRVEAMSAAQEVKLLTAAKTVPTQKVAPPKSRRGRRARSPANTAA
jgi:hypothetical protein